MYNDKTLTNEQEHADSFNLFFANVGAQLSSSISVTSIQHVIRRKLILNW